MKRTNKLDKKTVTIIPSSIDHFYKFIPKDKEGKIKSTGVPMVRIKGDFFGGGFNLSKNKAKAILNNIDIIKEFADGQYDKAINKLKEGEVFTPGAKA